MPRRKYCLSAGTFAVSVLAGGLAWALGLGLGETKEQLKLKYDVSVTDHGTGRATIRLTIADQGRLKPLSSVDLVIPSKDGTGFVDLSLPIAMKEVGANQVAYIHLKRELAERAEVQLKTSSLDGKQQALTWYYHEIPLANYMKADLPEKDARPVAPGVGRVPNSN